VKYDIKHPTCFFPFHFSSQNKKKKQFFKNKVIIFRSFISDLAEDRKIALERLNETISLAESHIKVYESGQIPKGVLGDSKQDEDTRLNLLLDAKIVLADSYTLLATIQVMEEVRLKGMMNLRKGWRMYKDLAKEIESSKVKYDPVILASLKFGVGLFNFLLSLIPPGLPQVSF
jgi:hypothetical protein